MNQSLPTHWGDVRRIDPILGEVRPTAHADTLALQFDGLAVDLEAPPRPQIASAAAAVWVPWRLAGRDGLRGLAVDVRGFVEGDGDWRGDLVVQVGTTTQVFDLRSATPGAFTLSLTAPPWFDRAAQVVPILVTARLTVQRTDPASRALARVDVVTLRAEFRPAAATRGDHPCACGGEFDAQQAIVALSRDMARIVDLAAEQAPAPGDALRMEAAKSGMPAYLRLISEHRALQSAAEIIGGRTTREFPSCCCIGDDEGFNCSAVLVRPRVVLTAAHCGASITRVFIGGWDIGKLNAGELLGVRAVVPHPRYDAARNLNDITVIVLAEDAGTPPVALASEDELAAAEYCALVGFGRNDPTRPLGFGLKRETSAPIAALRRDIADDLSEAASRLGFDPEHEFVAGRKGLGRDSCNGDSGGPAYVLTTSGPRLLGLTSRATRERANNCGDGGIYVLPIRHLDWIRAVVAKHGVMW